MKLTWTITSLEVVSFPKPNYVVRVAWYVTGQLGDVENGRGGITQFDIIQENNFVSFENLTEVIVLDWVKKQLGEETVLELENSISESLGATPNLKPIAFNIALPWSN
jgi:hypothetical protein